LGGAVAQKRFDHPVQKHFLHSFYNVFGGPGGYEFAWSCSVMDRNSGSFRGRGFGGTLCQEFVPPASTGNVLGDGFRRRAGI